MVLTFLRVQVVKALKKGNNCPEKAGIIGDVRFLQVARIIAEMPKCVGFCLLDSDFKQKSFEIDPQHMVWSFTKKNWPKRLDPTAIEK